MVKGKIFILLLGFLFLIGVPVVFGAEPSHSVSLLSNTDQAIIDCESEYEVCALTKDVSVGVKFNVDTYEIIRNKNNQIINRKLINKEIGLKYSYIQKESEQPVKDLFISSTLIKHGTCEIVTIKAKKKFNENIDHIPIIDGTPHYEYAWWNMSWQNKTEIVIDGTIKVNGSKTHLYTTNFSRTGCNQIDYDDIRITWENSTDIIEQSFFYSGTSTTGLSLYFNSTTNEGKYYLYCGNPTASNGGTAGNDFFYFFRDASLQVGVNNSIWTYPSEILAGDKRRYFQDKGTYYEVYSYAAKYCGGAVGTNSINLIITANQTTYTEDFNNSITIMDLKSSTVSCGGSATHRAGSTYHQFATLKEYYKHSRAGSYSSGAFSTSLYNYATNAKATVTTASLREIINTQSSNINETKFYRDAVLKWTNTSLNYGTERDLYIKSYSSAQCGGVSGGYGATCYNTLQFYWYAFDQHSGVTAGIEDLWDISPVHVEDVLEKSVQDYYLTLERTFTTNTTWNLTMSGSVNLSFSIDNSTINATIDSATITNITFKVSKTLPESNDTVLNLTWFWSLNVPVYSGNVSVNQSVYSIRLDNCSVYSQRAINFSLFDEESGDPIVGEVDTILRTYSINPANYRTNIFNLAGFNNYSLCRNPTGIVYYVDSYTFEFGADGYVTKEYVIDNLAIGSSTHVIDLFLLNESSSDNVVITLRDTDDNVLEDYTIKVKRFYPGTGDTEIVEIVNTDYAGTSIVHLVLNDIYYGFVIEKDGVVLEEIPLSKIYTTSKTFIIDLGATLNFENMVWYSVSPDSHVDSVVTNFSLFTDSPDDLMEWASISIYFNGSYYSDNISLAGGGTSIIELNLTGFTGWLNFNYSIKAVNESVFSFVGGYLVINMSVGDYSVVGQKDSWEGFLDEMWRVIAAVLVSIIAVLVLVPFIGSESAGVVGVLVQIGFVAIGWIPIWMVIIEAIILGGMYLLVQRGGA